MNEAAQSDESNTEGLREIEREIAAAFIFSSDGKLLMGRKDPTKGGVYPNAWHIPGGGVEVGETLQQAMLREAGQEVVGLDLSRGELKQLPQVGSGATVKTLPTGEVVWCKMRFNHFEAHLDKTAAELETFLKPGDDLVELRWFNRDELASVEQIPGGKELMIQSGYIAASS